ncbi:MAG: hypothetical protein UY48_C0030G0007 [Candidatus Gottesmanbacteria bacterium GW2011_GWB1_49_7]|uniref:Uncharacterized protein n=1 Tax=Candidatus Gottesmanbacteria bacterium GW2011_GWB1_49_7 TaxID=1618448 RepID=A0A0G1VWU2_9BACT|nr:MAG: hypothetical protein UY48_C0030G0007 [Candidatus Gottesmanbacteria bacterium GW2011_GWB1_49_7]
MSEELNSDQQRHVTRALLLKFQRALKMNINGTGTPVWKSVFFILDHLARGDFYGTIELRIMGCTVKDPRIVERTYKVDDMYRSIEDCRDLPPTESDLQVLSSSLQDISSFMSGNIPEPIHFVERKSKSDAVS